MSNMVLAYIFTGSFIILDIISGFSQAVANKTVDSSIMRRGLWHKLAYVFAIMLAVLCQYGVGYIPLGVTVDLIIPVCSFISLTEIVSIIENLAKLNPDIADSKLLDLFSINRNRRIEDKVEYYEREYNRDFDKE